MFFSGLISGNVTEWFGKRRDRKVGPLNREPNHGLSPSPVPLANPLSGFEQVPMALHLKTQRQCLTWEKGFRTIVLDQPQAKVMSGCIPKLHCSPNLLLPPPPKARHHTPGGKGTEKHSPWIFLWPQKLTKHALHDLSLIKIKKKLIGWCHSYV